MEGRGDNSCTPRPSSLGYGSRTPLSLHGKDAEVRVHSRNATLTAPLGSLHLGLVVVHGKTKAGGNVGDGGATANGAATVDGPRRRSTVAADEVSGGRGN